MLADSGMNRTDEIQAQWRGTREKIIEGLETRKCSSVDHEENTFFNFHLTQGTVQKRLETLPTLQVLWALQGKVWGCRP